MGTINDKLEYLNQTKQDIKQAIINKGQNITDEDTFRSYVDKINDIELGILSQEQAEIINMDLDSILNEQIPDINLNYTTGELTGGFISNIYSYDKNLDVAISKVILQTGEESISFPLSKSTNKNVYVYIKNKSNKPIIINTISIFVSFLTAEPCIIIGYGADYTGSEGIHLEPNEVYTNNQYSTIARNVNDFNEFVNMIYSCKWFNISYDILN